MWVWVWAVSLNTAMMCVAWLLFPFSHAYCTSHHSKHSQTTRSRYCLNPSRQHGAGGSPLACIRMHLAPVVWRLWRLFRKADTGFTLPRYPTAHLYFFRTPTNMSILGWKRLQQSSPCGETPATVDHSWSGAMNDTPIPAAWAPDEQSQDQGPDSSMDCPT